MHFVKKACRQITFRHLAFRLFYTSAKSTSAKWHSAKCIRQNNIRQIAFRQFVRTPCMYVCIYHQEQSTHGVATTTILWCRSGGNWTERASNILLDMWIVPSTTPAQIETVSDDPWPCTASYHNASASSYITHFLARDGEIRKLAGDSGRPSLASTFLPRGCSTSMSARLPRRTCGHKTRWRCKLISEVVPRFFIRTSITEPWRKVWRLAYLVYSTRALPVGAAPALGGRRWGRERAWAGMTVSDSDLGGGVL